MSYIKRWFEEHIDQLTDAQLADMGYSDEEIELLRESFSEEKDT